MAGSGDFSPKYGGSVYGHREEKAETAWRMKMQIGENDCEKLVLSIENSANYTIK